MIFFNSTWSPFLELVLNSANKTLCHIVLPVNFVFVLITFSSEHPPMLYLSKYILNFCMFRDNKQVKKETQK